MRVRYNNKIEQGFKKIFTRKTGGALWVQIVALFLSSSLLLFFVSARYVEERALLARKKELEKIKLEVKLPEISVQAKSFVVFDVRNDKVLLSKEATTSLPLASLTKVKTAYLFASMSNLQETIVIPSLGKNHDYDFTLKPGDIWKTSDLIKFMLTISSNDVAEILAMKSPLGREDFIKVMNNTSASTSLIFTTPNGLDIGENIGGIGSAVDMAKLLKDFYKEYPELFEATNKTSLTVIINGRKISGVPNTNRDVETYTGISGSKTGFTDKAGGNLAILYDEALGRPLIIVLLGSTREGRFHDMKNILSYIKEHNNELYQREK